MTCDTNEKTHLTVLLPAGQLPLDMMAAAHTLAQKYNLTVYLTSAQNMRLLNVPPEGAEEIKAVLGALGAQFKKPGTFPIPNLCLGKPHCNLGLIDTKDLSDKILAKFSSRPHTKGKIKIAIAGCGMSCSNAKLTDIGIIANRKGFDIYAGGKGGGSPRTGTRIIRDCNEEEVLNTIDTLIEYHDSKTEKKQRMAKLLTEADFPFKEA